VTPTNANEPIIAAVLLIDPIPFLLHHPQSRTTLSTATRARERVAAAVLCEPDIALALHFSGSHFTRTPYAQGRPLEETACRG
jgi:hypothetical protein